MSMTKEQYERELAKLLKKIEKCEDDEKLKLLEEEYEILLDEYLEMMEQ